MSTITKAWTEDKIRSVIRKLDEKTGLNGASLPITLSGYGRRLGYYRRTKPNAFGFNRQFFNDPHTKESEVIDVIRHEYAHYYDDIAGLADYIHHSRRETSHGDNWKWACKMVGANPTRYHSAAGFADKNWTTDEAEAACNADDVAKFDILSYLDRWHQIPVDAEIAAKALAHIKERNPDAYYENGDDVLHPKRGFGTVRDTIPYDYRTQKIYVRFEDQTDGVFETKDLCKIVDGVVIPYHAKGR